MESVLDFGVDIDVDIDIRDCGIKLFSCLALLLPC